MAYKARTLATQTGMTNQWLKDQGLVSVKELWVNIYPPLEDPLPDYGPVGSVNRPSELVLSLSKDLSASGGDPHAGWCGEGEFKAPLYPIGQSIFFTLSDVNR
jgi:hypothetical protein